MAKTYILEPTEAQFALSQDEFKANVNFDWTTLDGYPGDEAEDEEIDTFLANTFSGSKFKMMYGEEPISLIYTDVDNSVRFTVSGEYVEDSYPYAWVNFADLDQMKIVVTLAEGTSVIPVDGTYTVSIYTGEDDAEPEPSGNGLPDMNITYEFANTAKNDIEDIIQAIYINLDQDEPQAPGHSPADRLVIAVAKLNNVDPDTALYTGGYPNHMKRIAAIIRGDFSE